MPEPTDKKLYKQVRKRVYKKIPNIARIAVALLFKNIKNLLKKHGNKNPIKVRKREEGIKRWFAEKW